MKKEQKKQQTDWTKNLSRAFIVVIIFVCVAGFTLTMPFFSIFKSAKPGSMVIVDYTIKEKDGTPVVTSFQKVAEDGVIGGLSQPLQIVVGENQTSGIVRVPMYYPQGTEYALFSTEIEDISGALDGMHQGDMKHIQFDNVPVVMNMTPERFNGIYNNSNYDFNTTNVGAWLPVVLSDSIYVSEDNTSLNLPVRMVKVVDKTPDEILMSYDYDSVDISLREINV